MAPRISVLELRSVRGTGGGPEKTILFGAELRDRQRFDVTVCYIRDLRDDVFGVEARARRLDIDYVEALERHSLDPRVWATLKDLVATRRIDIVHSHDYKTDLLSLMLSWRMGVIPLGTAHGWTGHSVRERLIYYPMGKRLLSRFPRVIAVSTDIKNELVRCGAAPGRVVVLLNGIDPAAFRREVAEQPVVRKELGYSASEVVIGCVGRLERQKRFDLLMEAFAQLSQSFDHLRLVIVGDGSLRTELTNLATRLELGSRCQLLGHRENIARLHHAFDLFVQSSTYEGTPNAVLEAMALETPLVATDVGGTSEVVWPDIHGLIVPANVAALRGAIQNVLVDPEAARRRANAARRRIEEELSFEARTRRLETIYGELMDGRPSSVKRVSHLA
ncbi:MAG: glycosyltransferase [Vicinamibacterales bacterium]